MSTDWQEVISYDASSLIHKLTTAVDPIVTYGEYRFRYKSVNTFGSSAYSAELAVAVAPLPQAPEPVTKIQELNSKNSMTLSWAPPLVDPDRVLGY